VRYIYTYARTRNEGKEREREKKGGGHSRWMNGKLEGKENAGIIKKKRRERETDAKVYACTHNQRRVKNVWGDPKIFFQPLFFFFSCFQNNKGARHYVRRRF
jgi:hypothetical protein